VEVSTAIAIVVLATLAAVVQSTAGFGFSLMLVPLLSLVIGPKETVVLSNILSAVLEAVLLIRVRQHVEWKLGGTLFAGALVGMPVGLLVVIFLSAAALKIVIAITVIFFTLMLMRGLRIHSAGRGGNVAAGVVSGVLNTSTSMSGPPVVLYLQGRGIAPGPFRATLFAYFSAISAIAVGLLAATGNFTGHVAFAAVVAVPSLVVGGFIGNRLHHRVPEERFRHLVYAILIASAISAIVSAVS
jgi:uncharacterized membrane protein YfcA